MPRFAQPEPPLPGEVVYNAVIHSTEEERLATQNRLVRLLVRYGLIDEDEFGNKAQLVLNEALVNAMEHGNQRDATRTVIVSLAHDGRRWGVRVEDEGEGFAEDDLPNPRKTGFAISSEGGRGVLLMDTYMDDCCYAGRGNVLVMTKRVKP